MIYTHEDKHPIVSALKKKGWILFDVTASRVTKANGICGGWCPKMAHNVLQLTVLGLAKACN